jgi:hypothetical protein
VLRTEREGEAERGERRLTGELQQSFSQQPQRDLRVGALEHRASEAQQHIAAAIVAGQAARGIDQVRRPLVEARAVAFDMENPAGLAGKPFAQPLGMAAHGGEVLVRCIHKRRHQQGAQAGTHLVALEALLAFADAATVLVVGAIRSHRPSRAGVMVIR